jgi:UDP-galactopyranose mutase
MLDFAIIGAGLCGATIARCLADAGASVIVYEQNRIGGLCHDSIKHGILCHSCGPHIIHTDSPDAWNFLKRFAEFLEHKHRASICVDNKYYPFPLNKKTKDEIGEKKYQALKKVVFEGYGKKQWCGNDPPEDVKARIPNNDESESPYYFNEVYQGVPIGGYSKMIMEMLSGVSVRTQSIHYDNVPVCKRIILTGMIDDYYKFCFGKISYIWHTFNDVYFPAVDYLLPNAQVNYPEESHLELRAAECKHFFQEDVPGTVITYEFSMSEKTDDALPCYPIPWLNNNLHAPYAAIDKNLILAGRMAEYKYLDMDDVVLRGIECAQELLNEK